MDKKQAKLVYNLIKKYKRIVITRHIGADPDALGSEFALKELILNNFKNKEVYAVGYPAPRFKFIGNLDKMSDDLYNDSLLIVLDTPDKKRVDNVTVEKFKESIKIDHHPFLEKFCSVEIIDENASSAAEVITEFAILNNLKINDSIASNLYLGIISDSNRFLYKNTTAKTFKFAHKLIKNNNINTDYLHENLYSRPLSEIRFLGYILENIIVTDNGFGYIKITDDILKEYNVDAGSPGNMIDNLNYIDEVIVWATFTEDIKNHNIRTSIRSRGPIINKIAEEFNGGGHTKASGAKLKDFDQVDIMINKLDLVCREYK